MTFNEPGRPQPLIPRLRPTSAFAGGGAKPTVEEAACLLIEAVSRELQLDRTQTLGREGEELEVSGADIVGHIRQQLAAEFGRASLARFTLQQLQPALQTTLGMLGYAARRIAVEEEQDAAQRAESADQLGGQRGAWNQN